MNIYMVKDKLTGRYYLMNNICLIPATSSRMARKKIARRYKVKFEQLEAIYMSKFR